MLTRRAIVALPLGLAVPAAAGVPFQSFVAGVYREALGEGVRRSVLDAAFAGVAPNQKVIDLDRRQVEFTMTWVQYRARVVSEQKIAQGRAAVAQNRALLTRIDGVIATAESKYIVLNAPETALAAITEILPGAEAPTVVPLIGRPGHVAVQAVCQESVFWETLERLKAAGASAILVMPIEKMML